MGGGGGGGAGDEGRPFCVVTEQRAKHCDSQRLLLCGHRLVLGGTVPMFRLVEHIGVHWCVCVGKGALPSVCVSEGGG